MSKAYGQPLQATARDGEVVIIGQGHFHGSLEPEAVLASLDALKSAAETALAQRQRQAGPAESRESADIFQLSEARQGSLYYFHIDDGVRTDDKFGVELPNLTAARKEAAILTAELLRDRPDAFWDVQTWRMTVTNEHGLTLFTIKLDGVVAPAVARHFQTG